MSTQLVAQGLETALSTWAAAQSPALTVAWENVELVPQPEAAYLRAFVLPAATDSADLARDHRSYTGIFQVSVCVPTGTGSLDAQTIVSALEALFDPGTPITVGSLRVFITQPLSQGPGIPEPMHHVIPCSIPYRADLFV